LASRSVLLIYPPDAKGGRRSKVPGFSLSDAHLGTYARGAARLDCELRNRQTSFVVDGLAVQLGVDGVSDFNGSSSRRSRRRDRPDLFRRASEFGLEGLVSKRRDSRYRSGLSQSWIKNKNRCHPAMMRVKDAHS